MPKTNVDYSNTIIYKIYCKDESIKDIYVGHTTNFIQRKYLHKMACSNTNNTLKIYNVIRCNGGWDNWDMVEIAKYNCKDSTEARIKEQEHFDILKATLNSCPPHVDVKKYFCSPCHLQCIGPKQYNQHIKCVKHNKKCDIKPIESIEKPQKNAKCYYCEKCAFNTCNKKDYSRHILTKKHIINNNQCFSIEKPQYECICGKIYKENSGLWRHKKRCKYDEKNDMMLHTNNKLIEYLMKENKEIKELILEIVKNGTHNTTNNTHTNSHNKAFNLNFFLNETCKNAMNITDFVDSIKLQLGDLMEVGELGYVEGISRIIVKNLNNLDETIRPIHCTDKKRETMYIKDEGQWEKEDDNKSKLKKVVTKVVDKNIRLLPAFREKYPEYKNSSSKTSDKYDKMVIEVMTTDEDKNEKIIKNISKVTTIKY
jgi:hypothetical protein